MNNQIPKFRELVIGTSFFIVQNMCVYSVLYRLYRFIQKLIKYPAQFCFLHGIRALVFLRAFSVQPSLLGPFLCSLHCCTQPSFLGISVQSSLLHLTFFQSFFRLLRVSFFFLLLQFFHCCTRFFNHPSTFSPSFKP